MCLSLSDGIEFRNLEFPPPVISYPLRQLTFIYKRYFLPTETADVYLQTWSRSPPPPLPQGLYDHTDPQTPEDPVHCGTPHTPRTKQNNSHR